MEFKKYFSSGNSNLRHNLNNKEKYIKELDDKNNNLTVDDITYALIDMIHDGIIEIEEIRKTYKTDVVNPRTDKERAYMTYRIEIFVKLLNKDKIKEYCDFRDDFVYEVMSEIHGHRILNTICNKYNHFVTIDSDRRRISERDDWVLPYDGDRFDEFDLYPNKIVWIDNNDINK